MFVAFDDDQIIYPRESQIFGELSKKDSNGQRSIINMEDTDWFKNDNLGLKYL
jgi:hypothetical protein